MQQRRRSHGFLPLWSCKRPLSDVVLFWADARLRSIQDAAAGSSNPSQRVRPAGDDAVVMTDGTVPVDAVVLVAGRVRDHDLGRRKVYAFVGVLGY